MFEQLKPLLVALDWNLPDTTGYHLCQEMQHRTNVFAIVLSSRTDEADKVKVLSASAEDYICKPFGLAELAIRIEVVLRRLRPVTRSRIVFDWFAIDSARREATLNDRIIKLIALEFNILYFLPSHSGQSWSRQQLSEKIWGWNCDDTGEEQIIRIHIGQMPKKMIQVDATGSPFIKTIRGYGYRFNPPDRTAMALS